jgi:hypothetical protein
LGTDKEMKNLDLRQIRELVYDSRDHIDNIKRNLSIAGLAPCCGFKQLETDQIALEKQLAVYDGIYGGHGGDLGFWQFVVIPVVGLLSSMGLWAWGQHSKAEAEDARIKCLTQFPQLSADERNKLCGSAGVLDSISTTISRFLSIATILAVVYLVVKSQNERGSSDG